MAFTVKLHGNGYRISVGDGRPVTAASVDELCQALRHYYCKPWHTHRLVDCPFCRVNGLEKGEPTDGA